MENNTLDLKVELSQMVFDDVKIIRESNLEVKDRIGIEIMALNAISNALKAEK